MSILYNTCEYDCTFMHGYSDNDTHRTVSQVHPLFSVMDGRIILSTHDHMVVLIIGTHGTGVF